LFKQLNRDPRPSTLVHIKKNEVHGHFATAKQLAETALTLPRPPLIGTQAIAPMRPFTTEVQCTRKRDGPSIWFKLIIIGFLKKGKNNTNPDSYRIIALESCLLKVLTLLIHKHITDWANAYGIIPDYQNGFREGYRTNNNPFILRCIKE
jgi:hypothetical protein